jgi:Domain of unknown function (DUF4823)
MKRGSLILLLAGLCGGCIHNYGLKSIERVSPLRTNGTALIALPEDVERGGVRHLNSGHDLALVITRVFASQMNGADLTLASGEWQRHLEPARASKFDYLVVPTVLAWEDKKSKGMGRSRRAEIELRIIETKSGKTLSLGRVKAKGQWEIDNQDGPPELLELPLRTYILWLFSPLDTPLPQPRIEPTQRGRR